MFLTFILSVFDISRDWRIAELLLNGSIPWAWSIFWGRASWANVTGVETSSDFLSTHHFWLSSLVFLGRLWTPPFQHLNHLLSQRLSGLPPYHCSRHWDSEPLHRKFTPSPFFHFGFMFQGDGGSVCICADLSLFSVVSINTKLGRKVASGDIHTYMWKGVLHIFSPEHKHVRCPIKGLDYYFSKQVSVLTLVVREED